MSLSNDELRVELEPAATDYREPPADRRKHLPEPPPVRLTAIEDVLAESPVGIDAALDDFYVAMLQFERYLSERSRLAYRA